MSTPPRIRLLPPELAEQIAAGEVVERPGSVVKELVENSFDAGARKIEVTLEAGGRRLIRVVDDGHGMTPEEAELALQRHATSKLSSADDLWRLSTFGFRGEALPSIAAVSKLVLATKTAGALAGYRLLLEGGRKVEAREHGMPDGTQIEVRDLFYNVPARLKFLKTEATEAGNVTEALLRLSLANPGVHVRLRSNDRMVLDLPPVTNLGERVRSALGRRGAGALHEAVGEEGGVKVHAFVGSPDEAGATPRNTFLFVERRAVRDRSLVAALAMAYGELIDKGRYPLAALFLEIPGGEVDVNVHPQKLEVRFAHAQEVYAAVRHVVAAAIAQAPWLGARRRPFSLPPPGDPDLGLEPEPREIGMPFSIEAAARNAAFGRPASPSASASSMRLAAEGGTGTRTGRSWGPPPEVSPAVPPAVADWGVEFFSGLHYIGQLHRTYLVCQTPGELVLVDQHAAHERLAFQRLRKAWADHAMPRQRLLFPVEIPIDDVALAVAFDDEARARLERLGFEVDALAPGEGPRLVLRAVPELLKDAPPKALLLDALAGLGDAPATDAAEAAADKLFATLACHSVVRAGDALTREEAVALLASLDEVDLRSHCPHGRPVLVRFSVAELERRFGRA